MDNIDRAFRTRSDGFDIIDLIRVIVSAIRECF